MQPKGLSEVLAIVNGSDFQAWWISLQKARAELAAAEQLYDELVAQTTLMEFRAELTQKNAIDRLYRAGECEDEAAAKVVESTGLENRSFRAVSAFEEQRIKVSEIWYKLGAAEKRLDEKREDRGARKTKRSDSGLRAAERAYRSIADEYETQTAHQNRLWEEVERIWGSSTEVSLLVSELRIRGKRLRKEAETFFAIAEERHARAKSLRSEAESSSVSRETARMDIRKLLGQIREIFGCAAGAEFLYFRQRDNHKFAYAVSLIDDADTYNVPVKTLFIYAIDRQRGVAFLEPVGESSLRGTQPQVA